MKSRMKKLLAAALALCLIAALVPGAALAADTGNFSTPTKGKPETKTYHATLAEAIAYVGGFTSAENKVVTVEANSVEISSNISDRNVKLVVPEGKAINISNNVEINAAIELNGSMNVASGRTATINGSLTGDGTIVVSGGTTVSVAPVPSTYGMYSGKNGANVSTSSPGLVTARNACASEPVAPDVGKMCCSV